MPDFRDALKEVYSTQNKSIIFMAFLSSIVIFFVLYAFLTLIHLYPKAALPISIIFFFLKSSKDIKQRSLIDVEKSNPALSEMLRTAADTIAYDNFIIERLRESVLDKLRFVRISSFFNLKKIFNTLLLICFLAGVNVIISASGFQIIDMEAKIKSLSSWDFGMDLLKGQVPDSILDHGVRIEDVNDNTQVSDVDEQIKLRALLKRENALPEEIFKSSDKSFEESMSKKRRIFIRNYFSEIRRMEG